jgi:hypothetical protein
MSDRRPIGVLDSGVGGISVLRELLRVMPQEDFIFLGDTKNAPYGTKDTEAVRRITFDNVTVEELTAEEKKRLSNKEPIETNYTIGIFLDIHYIGDAQATHAYGTLCIYDCEMPWEVRDLKSAEKESFVNFPIN